MKKIISTAVTAALFAVAAHGQETGFYEDKERGWFWYEQPPVIEEEELAPQPTPPPATGEASDEMVELDFAWLKANFPKIMERTLNHPTEENLATFAYAQRLMLDMSSRFQSKMMDFMMDETQLDESIRRPNEAFALNTFKSEVKQQVDNAIGEINDNSLGLWFFYSSTCKYCYKMIPVLQRFQQLYGVKILGVSLDGGVIPGMESMQIVYDQDQYVARRFNISMTPTTMLVLPDESTQMVAEGMRTLTDLEKRYIRAGRIKGLISQETYERTKSVYELNLYQNENGSIMVNKERLENDPRFLAEALRNRLSDVQVFGTQLLHE